MVRDYAVERQNNWETLHAEDGIGSHSVRNSWRHQLKSVASCLPKLSVCLEVAACPIRFGDEWGCHGPV